MVNRKDEKMKSEVSYSVAKTENEFRKLKDFQKLYYVSILLNHLYNGLINEGNYSSEDESYENNAEVLTSELINLDDPMKLATNLLVVGSKMESKIINPNGIDIEPYINEVNKLGINNFYKLNYKDKIDFLTDIIYIISEIEEVGKLKINFNDIINELLNYSKNIFEDDKENMLEIEENNCFYAEKICLL